MVNMNPVPQVDITDDDKLWALLSWILAPLVPIIVLLMEDKKQRPFIKYNAIPALALSIVGYIISGALSVIFVGCFTGVALFVYQIILGVKAYKGEWVTVPVVTDFCKKQGWIS